MWWWLVPMICGLASPAGAQQTQDVTVAHAAFAHPRAPSAVVHTPRGFDRSRPFDVVVFLHGWTGCARVLARPGRVACREGEPVRDGWGLTARHDESGVVQSVLVVPQLAWMARDGRPGRFAEPGVFRAFLEEVLARHGGLARVRAVTLAAHSAGFESAAAILANGGVEIRNVVLFDALYARPAEFARWVAAAPDRRLVSLHTTQRTILRMHALLIAQSTRELGADAVARDPAELGPAIRTHRVVIARTTVGHGAIPSHYLDDVVRVLAQTAGVNAEGRRAEPLRGGGGLPVAPPLGAGGASPPNMKQ